MKKTYTYLIATFIISTFALPSLAQDQPKQPGVNIIITQSPKIIVKVAAVTNNVCAGETKGAINIEPTGGYPPYKYHWSNGDTTQDIAALKAGSYNVAVYDGFSCSDTIKIEVKEPLKLETTLVHTTDILCYGYNNGEIDISVKGGATPYQYHWSNGARTEDLKGVNSGEYSVLITDANSCQEIFTAGIQEKPLIVRSLDDVQNIKCEGDKTGKIDLSVGGGVPPYTYEWNNGATSEDLKELKAGVYEVVVKDSKGCTEVSSTKVVEPGKLTINFDEVKNLRCTGDTGGSINIDVIGGTQPYVYQWSNGTATQDITGVPAGNYTIKINDANGCATSATKQIIEPPLLGVELKEVKDVSSSGGKNGSIDIEVTGGSPPYKYKWSNGSDKQDLTGLEAGAYSLRITDATGCAKMLSTAITQPTVLVVQLDNVTQILCNGVKSGEIGVSVAGGVSPYTYAWSSGQNTKELKGLGAGKYSLLVTDQNGATKRVETTIAEPLPFKSQIVSSTNVTCFGVNNGAIDIKAEGGVVPYRYRWSNGASSQDLVNLSAGNYSVKITDANGCENDLSTSLTQPDAIKLALQNVTNILCSSQNSGAVNLGVTGGVAPYQYKWNNGAVTEDVQALKAGNYSVQVKDSKGCADQIAVEIKEPRALVVVETLSKNVDCKGSATGSIEVNVSGGVVPYKYGWNSGDTTRNIYKIKAGTYNFKATDANGCAATLSRAITEPTKVVHQLDGVSNVSCFGEAKGAVNISVSGGVTPYSYRWSSGAITQDISGVKAGRYAVQIIDANNCTDSLAVVIKENTALASKIAAKNISCFGLKTGAVDLSVNGGVRPYRYQWSNNVRTEDIAALGAGNYSVMVRDSAGCTLTADARIIEPPKLVASLQSYTDIKCFSNKTGAIAIKITGGTLPYKYKWNTGDTTLSLANVAAGNYSFAVTDNGGCQQTIKALLSQPTKVDYSIKSVKNVSCFNDKNGGVDLSVSGGVGPYLYAWSNGFTTQDLENIAAGKYNVQIMDAKGCQQSIAAEVVQPTELIVKLDTINHIQCFGNRNGSIFITVSGGVAPYKYLWSNGATIQDINQLPAGQYNVTVIDSKSCLKTISATVKQPDPFVAKLGEVKNISCFGETTGKILTAVSGGVTPYAFKWSNGASSQNLENVAAGNYTVVITDKNGCSQTLTATISQPAKLVASILSVKDVACNGLATGSVNISVVGGSQPYKYSWSNGSATRDLTATKAGNYKLRIVDANGCKDSTIVATIKEPTVMDVKIVKVTDIAQYGLSTGAIDVSVTGGVLPHQYSWSNGAITQDITGVPGGNYSLKVYDNNGCDKTVSATINQPPPLLVKLLTVQDVKCAEDKTGSIDIDVAGGVPPYRYRWSSGDSTKNLSNIVAGEYLLTVTDATGNNQILTAKIAQPSAIIPQIDYSKNLSCYNDNSGIVRVTVSGGNQPYKFLWSSGQTTEDLSSVPAGDYSLTVTDSKGCTQSVKTSLTQPEQFVAKVVSVKDVSCKGDKQGEIKIDVSGGVAPYKYSWNNGEKSKDVTAVSAGNYTLLATDANSCAQNLQAAIKEPAELIATLGSVINNNCFGQSLGSIQLAVSGGVLPYKFVWSSGDSTQNISKLPSGDYSVNIRDSKGCNKSLKSSITSPILLEAKLNTVVDVKCYGDKTGAISVDVNGGTKPYAFKWNNGDSKQNLISLPSGDYQLTVNDGKGCTISVVTKVQQPAQLVVAMDTVYNVKCAGDSKGFIDISVAGGVTPYNYLWSNGIKTEDIVSAVAGSYSIKVQDLNGCTTNQTATITEPPRFTLVLDSLLNVTCSSQETGKITVRAAGGVQPYNYLWNNGSSSNAIRHLRAGEYSVTSTDANGCKASFSEILTQPTTLIKSIDAITDIRCNGEKSGAVFVTVLQGVSPYKFKWSNGADTEDISNLTSGKYSLVITEGNGCQSVLEATIEEPPPFDVNVASQTNIKCSGQENGAVEINVAGGVQPYSYAWSNGSKEQSLTALKADSYSVLVTDGNGCLRTLHTKLTEPTKMTLHIDSVRNVKCCGDASGAIFISVIGGLKPYKYQWSHGATTEDITNLTLGVYTVNVTDANGCVVSTPDEMSLYEQVVSKGMFSTREILFDVAKATIKPQSFTTINKIATFMKEYPSTSFSIEGHTDSDGDAVANQKLSEARAEAIKQALVKFGIRDYRMKTKGWGEAKPIAVNTTVDGKSLNRRVEFISLTGTLKGDFQEILK